MVEFRRKEMTEESASWKRNQRKLSKYLGKYSHMKLSKPAPWGTIEKHVPICMAKNFLTFQCSHSSNAKTSETHYD